MGHVPPGRVQRGQAAAVIEHIGHVRHISRIPAVCTKALKTGAVVEHFTHVSHVICPELRRVHSPQRVKVFEHFTHIRHSGGVQACHVHCLQAREMLEILLAVFRQIYGFRICPPFTGQSAVRADQMAVYGAVRLLIVDPEPSGSAVCVRSGFCGRAAPEPGDIVPVTVEFFRDFFRKLCHQRG